VKAKSVNMPNDRTVGGGIFAGSVLGIVIYAGLLYYFPLFILEVTAFIAVALLLGILAWIGYTMATTPPPEPITEIPETKSEMPITAETEEKKK